MKQIPLSQESKKNAGKYFALVDDEDYERVNKIKWCATTKRNNTRYAWAYTEDGWVYMHRFILNMTDKKIVDHIDRDGLNCQKDFDKERNKYMATIRQTGKKTKFLGRFSNEIEAANAYNKAAIIYHKEFANLNIFE